MQLVTPVRPTDASHFYLVQDSRSIPTQLFHIAQAALRQCFFGCRYARNSLCPDKTMKHIQPKTSEDTGRYDLDALPWNTSDNSEGLCLFLHGLNASPQQWKTYTTQFVKIFPNTHHLAPYIFQLGNCSLESAGDPLVAIIEHYLKKFPGKCITLIGTSNGTRIASYIETAINPDLFSEKSRLMIISIAGAHGGSRLMQLATRLCCRALCKHHPEIQRDLSFGSERCSLQYQQLQAKDEVWRKRNVVVSHTFYATTEDEQIRPISSCLPYFTSITAEGYHILSGHTHETIVDGVYDDILSLLTNFKLKSE